MVAAMQTGVAGQKSTGKGDNDPEKAPTARVSGLTEIRW